MKDLLFGHRIETRLPSIDESEISTRHPKKNIVSL